MELITKRPKGTQDILPEESYKWKFLEDLLINESSLYGFRELRTPVFEHTELFLRSVGEGTDVVEKEMYTFEDKGKRSISLRPEGTAGAVRAVVENGVYNKGLPQKLSYLSSCYRYEKPQAGRLREFHQFGLEVFGTNSPSADAELIAVGRSIFDRLGLSDIELRINSIGCPTCRKKYYEALVSFLKQREDKLCPTCLDRLKSKPMRVLDCKDPGCKEEVKDAPIVLDYLCEECKDHFEKLQEYLKSYNIEYTVDHSIVRGLDYYTRTVFEFVSNSIGAQGTVCGGGRYDGLVKEIGGPCMQCVGFGLGIERILLLMENSKIEIPMPSTCDLYIASMDEKSKTLAIRLSEILRRASLKVETDISDKTLKAQMKFADKIDAKFSMVLGEEELGSCRAKLKNMATGDSEEISIGDNFMHDFLNIYLKQEDCAIIK